MANIIWKNDVKMTVIHKIKCGGRTTPIGAGTPFNANGEIANDGTAIGISAEESVYPHRCCVDLIVGGCIDERKRLAASGIELTDECKAALKNIKFIDIDDMDSSFGGGGSDSGGGGGNSRIFTMSDIAAIEVVEVSVFGEVAEENVLVIPVSAFPAGGSVVVNDFNTDDYSTVGVKSPNGEIATLLKQAVGYSPLFGINNRTLVLGEPYYEIYWMGGYFSVGYTDGVWRCTEYIYMAE